MGKYCQIYNTNITPCQNKLNVASVLDKQNASCGLKEVQHDKEICYTVFV